MGKKIQCIGRYIMDGLSLGKGNFARVELATHGVTCCKVAIKIIDTRKIKEDYTRNNLHREARILGQIRHPNIIRLYETLKATTLYCLVLEYVPGGDLLTFIKSQKEGRLPENKARPYFRQLVSAIHFLHERGVAHRDLKMENILLDEKHKNVKVIDFGLSNTFSGQELMKTHCGSLEYAAPELIATNDKYGPEVDIWSLGIILYGMIIGKLPFSTHYTDQYRRQKLLVQIEKGVTENHVKELKLHGATLELIELLKKLIEPNVDYRLPLRDCESHPWITNNTKIPFFPFQTLPKDKVSKSQVIDELSALLEVPRDQVEKTVHETKCDDFSAMFNMMLDSKRSEKGSYDIDFTQINEPKRERHRRKHRHRATTGKKDAHKSKTRYYENSKSNHITKQQSAGYHNEILPDSPENFNIPMCFWEEFVKDLDVTSDHEGEPKYQSHNSTNFDLMALCSAPTWLGGDHRKGRRKKSPMPPPVSPSPFQINDPINKPEVEGAASAAPVASASAAVPPPEHANLLSPTQAGSQVAQLLRRSSSRRRSQRRTSSCDPPSRHGSRRSRRHRPGTPGSDPHSPHSPLNLNNPEIKIITPKQSPVSAVKRPANLVGLKECYTSQTESKPLKRRETLGPSKVNSHRRKSRATTRATYTNHNDTVDGIFHSDSSNPCSTTNLHDYFSDGSQEMLSQPPSRPDSRASIVSHDNPREQSVESKIAAADIRSIVRPKQIVLKGKVNGPKRNTKVDNVGNLQVPVDDVACRSLSASPEIIIESMQPASYANLSDDEKIERQMSCELAKTDSEKRVELEKTDLRIPPLLSSTENIHSSTELLGAACLKPVIHTDLNDPVDIHNSESLHDLCTVQFYANTEEEPSTSTRQCAVEMSDDFSICDQASACVEDLYSKKEKISLEDKIHMHDDVCYVDSSDHNSSQENFFSSSRRRVKESLTSDEVESLSAPILLSPRDLGLTLNEGVESGEAGARPRVGSVMSSRHGSTPSVRFVMPSTPIRQMFKTPIARIESFHSDDFEIYTSEVDALVTSPSPSPSPNSIQTPTVPCFQYKINSRRKKDLLRKASKHRQRKYCKEESHLARDGVVSFLAEGHTKGDVRVNDTLFSSSSECGSEGQVPDGDKASNASRAKIFPMEKDEDQTEVKTNIMTSQMNDKTKAISERPANQNSTRKHQNSVCKSFLSKQSQDNEPKKSAWRRGFAHLLKKKKFVSSGNNNNDVDSLSRNRSSQHSNVPNSTTSTNNRSARNGHARGTIPVTPPNTLDIPVTNVEIKWSQAKVVQNNIKANTNSGNHDIEHSPTPSPSPSKTKVFDLTIVPSSDASKSKPCLLSWKACRECTFSDDQTSSEGSDGNVCGITQSEKADVTTSIPMTTIPMATIQSSSFTTCKTTQS